MTDLGPILDQLAAYMMVLFRLSGIFVFTPVLNSAVIPVRIKVLLTVMLAASVYALLPAPMLAPTRMDLWSIVPIALSEVLLGAAIGVIASVPMVAMELGGYFMGHKMGLAMAQSYNPELDSSSDVVAQLVFYLAYVAFLAGGGLEILYKILLSTFGRLPPGSVSPMDAPADVLVGVISSGVEMAVRVSGPVVGLVFCQTLAMGFIMKSIPQINVLSVGFAVKIVVGLLALAAALRVIEHVGIEEMRRTFDQIERWAAAAGQPAT